MIEHIQVIGEQGPQSAGVVATNVYLISAQRWQLVAHPASPGSPRELQLSIETASVLR